MISTESLVGLIFFCVFSILFVKNVVQDLTSAGIDWQREKWQSGLGSKFIHQGEKNAAKYADEVIVLSKGVQDYFKETYGRETHFIPNGVNRPQIREASLITDKFGLKKDSYILFLGRLVPEKGIRYLVEAFKNVKTDKNLVIAGGSSDTDTFMAELKELAKGDDRILFTGFVQGAMLDELYSNAYIYTLPSDLEGMPLSLLEAMSYGNCCLVSDIPECAEVVEDKALKGFVGIHPNWSGINAESIRSLCLNAYLPEEVVELNDMTEMRSGKKTDMALLSDYLTVSGTCFINQSSPVITISKNGIRFSKACHTRLDDCEHVELLYHPILQVVILRKSKRDASTAIHWENKDKICSSFSSRAFSEVIFEAMNWKWSCRYQCRGICRGKENAKFLIFELDESRILIGKNQYEQIEGCSIDLKCRLYRSKWIQSIAASDVMKFGQVVENPMIGAIPSRNEVQRELDDLLMSM